MYHVIGSPWVTHSEHVESTNTTSFLNTYNGNIWFCKFCDMTTFKLQAPMTLITMDVEGLKLQFCWIRLCHPPTSLATRTCRCLERQTSHYLLLGYQQQSSDNEPTTLVLQWLAKSLQQISTLGVESYGKVWRAKVWWAALHWQTLSGHSLWKQWPRNPDYHQTTWMGM